MYSAFVGGQFGGAAGARVNYLTKSGSNTLHGNCNGTVSNANDSISNATESPRPSNIAHQWAGSLGGPIKKNASHRRLSGVSSN
jgi:hypothetical protein